VVHGYEGTAIGDFPFIIFHHYRPNVDWVIVCILLDLIELTPMRVGIDFNSQRLSSRDPARGGS
jgi:hypothetical protein